MEFTNEQIERYSRHLILSDVGVEGQQKISEAKVLVIGAGGLGAPVLLYLAAAGVGTLGVVDGDVVDLTNLQRQVIHFTADIDKPKVESAKEKIHRLNPDVTVNTYIKSATAENILELIRGYDFIVDGTDNFPAKFLINDACVLAKKPFSHAGILQFVGQTMTVIPGQSACYRCIFPEPPPPNTVPSCSQAGVLGAMAGIFGTLQATEALKYIIGKGVLLTDRLMLFDGIEMEFRNVALTKEKNCAVCGDNPSITALIDYEPTVCDLTA
ncbi:MAG: molybdopterin-synthase adenylyltransferase MoeB [Deltaproteobacteria bacterium]|nr:molybdopterin-synthase adenylyltransferase MoeB [Deltaproteobacteria bacterium]